jgi:hypothetical protein
MRPLITYNRLLFICVVDNKGTIDIARTVVIILDTSKRVRTLIEAERRAILLIQSVADGLAFSVWASNRSRPATAHLRWQSIRDLNAILLVSHTGVIWAENLALWTSDLRGTQLYVCSAGDSI